MSCGYVMRILHICSCDLDYKGVNGILCCFFCEKERYFRYILGFMLIVSEMSYYWRLVGVPELGPNPIDHLPITVCGWAVVFASYMVVGKSQKLFDIVYFWIFAGSIA